MKRMLIIASLLIIVLLFALPNIPKPYYYVCGRIRISAADIYAEVCATQHSATCTCGLSLWHGGKFITNADLTGVMVGDVAKFTSLDGERLVLECVSITTIPSWLLRANGDVLILNNHLVYRFAAVQ